MTISQYRAIAINVIGDGASTSVSIDLSSAPFSIIPELGSFSSSSPVAITQPGFDFRVSPPAGVVDANIGAGAGVGISASLTRSILTLTWDTAPSGSNEIIVRLRF